TLAPESEADVKAWLAREPGQAEMAELVQWGTSTLAYIEPYLSYFQDFVHDPAWSPVREFFDAHGYEQFNPAIVVALLRWVRCLPTHRDLLAEPPMLPEGPSLRPNERVLGDPDYIWYWATYLTALDDADVDEPVPEDVEVPFASE